MWLAVILLCLAPAAPANEPEVPAEELERIIYAQQLLLKDWAGLTRYGSDNSEVRLKPDEARVVFLGDDITANWGGNGGKFFPGKPYFNRGIERQTSPQMLVRFRQDVIGLKPKVVVIQAGSNDIAGYAGPMTESTSAENFMSMVEIARANGIRVVLASVTPVCDCTEIQTKRRSPFKIIGLNSWLKAYAEKTGSVYLDYYAALAEGRAMRKELTVDGLIPNEAGYAKMAEIAEKAIAEALSKN